MKVIIVVIVYNLACDHLHPFEGWFGSPADFENQRDRDLVECPVCGSTTVERKLHAPRINMGAQQSAASANSEARAASESKQSAAIAVAAEATHAAMNSGNDIDIAKLREAMVTFAANVRENTEYVGEKFAEEARAMHYGEKPLKGIRGRADKETAQELREEGITFQSLPFPVDFPNTH
ncbi:MAG: DUF1178 family protein [Rhizobacter sp.]|nr:DUF1178 family protein [Burkholderiales bacterium]